MIRKVRTFSFFVLTIFFITACKENEPKLEGAFGVKFGSDIEDVRNEISKLGDFKDLGDMILTKVIPETNPNFVNYTILYYDEVYNISADTIPLTEKEATDLFITLKNELIKKYGQPAGDTKEYESPNKFTSMQSNNWKIGMDEIRLELEPVDDKYRIYIVYRSVNTEEKLKKTHDSKGL